MTKICVECNEPFELEKKRGRPATRCPKCRGVAVTPKSKPAVVATPKAPTTKWTTYECPTCRYRTKQLSVATHVTCIRNHLKGVPMKAVEE